MAKHKSHHDDQPGPSKSDRAEPDRQSAPALDETEAAADQANLLEQLRTDLEGAKDRVLRSQAELENYRKRAAREIEDHRRYANLPLLSDLLPVLDNIQRAVDAADKTHDAASLLEGIKMVLQQFDGVLQRHHCVRIEALPCAVQSAPARGDLTAAERRVSAQHGAAGGPARFSTVRPRRAAEPGDRLDNHVPSPSGRGLG